MLTMLSGRVPQFCGKNQAEIIKNFPTSLEVTKIQFQHYSVIML
jgi:hypothetical protein